MHYTRNWRSFSLSPAAGEGRGEGSPSVVYPAVLSVGALEHLRYMWSPIAIRPGPAAQWIWELKGFVFRPTACFIPAQGNALGSSPVLSLQANGLLHPR